MSCQNGKAVAGRHEQSGCDDHVAVAVAVGRGSEVGCIRALHQFHQVMGMDGVRIRMVTAEIGLRLSVHHSACGRAEATFKNGFSIGPRHGARASKRMRNPERNKWAMRSKSMRLSISSA